MLFPNKLCSYQESVLSKLPIVLKALKDKPMSVHKLYCEVGNHMRSINEFIDVLDCLYALGRVTIDDDGGMLKYVA